MTTQRDTRVATYVTEEDRQQWEREADRAGKSLSQYVYDRVQRTRSEDTTDQKIRELSAEERLEQIVHDNRDSLLSIATEIEERNEGMADMAAIGAVYPIVNFHILKRLFGGPDGDLPEQWLSDQFSAASQKLREGEAVSPPSESEHSEGGGGSGSGASREVESESEAEPWTETDDLYGSD